MATAMATIGQRVRTSLDQGWRFHLGDPCNQDLCPNNTFAAFNGVLCSNWGHVNPHGQLTLEECRLTCCGDPECIGWTWVSHGHDCYIGDAIDECSSSAASQDVVGGRRVHPARPMIPPANCAPHTVGYNDSKWRHVNIPHDFVVEQQPSPTLEGSHGFRAKNVSWYRRGLSLDPQMRSGSAWLEFDGVGHGLRTNAL